MIGTHGIPKKGFFRGRLITILITVLLEVHKCTTLPAIKNTDTSICGGRGFESNSSIYSERERSIQSTNTFWEKQIKQYR